MPTEPALRVVTIWEVGMNSLTRDSVMLTVATLAVVCAVGTIFFASAQPLAASDPEICARPTSDVGAEASFLAENVNAMKKNDGRYGGEADRRR
jgi:hypothetical protein